MKLKTLLLIPILSSSIFAFNPTAYLSDHCDQLIVNPYFKVCYDYKLMGTKAVSYALDGEKVNRVTCKLNP
jgi:DNA/RNA endonuclease G (NUC1)